jgi:hypothetical protein
MANFPLLKALGWVTGELLTDAQLNALNAMLPKIPNFLEGSSHTPSGEVKLLGTVGMRIATMRGATRVTPDGDATPASITVGVSGSPAGNTIITDGTIEAENVLGSDVIATNVTADTFNYDSSAEVTINVPLISWMDPDGTNYTKQWETTTSSANPRFGKLFYQSAVTGVTTIYFHLPLLPTGCTIKRVGARLHGAGWVNNHGSNRPANMPTIELIKIDAAARTMTSVVSATDASASAAAYDVLHWVDTADVSHAYDPSAEYAISILGESGANSVVNALTLNSLRLTYSSFLPNR